MEIGAFGVAASHFHALGFNVLPVVGKHPPRGVRWGKWQSVRQSHEELQTLTARYPHCSLAIVNGVALAGGGATLVDIETDSRRAEDFIRELGLPLPATPSYSAPRGVHRWYRTQHPVRKSNPHPDLDVLGKGTYSIVPPSNGREWIVPLKRVQDVTPLPEPWYEYIHQVPAPAPTPNESRHISVSSLHEVELLADLKACGHKKIGKILSAWARATDGQSVADVLGFPRGIRLGVAFRCPLHDDWKPSASLWRGDRSGEIGLRDWHRAGSRVWYELHEVYLWQRTGSLDWGKPTRLLFTLDLLAQANLISPGADPVLPPLLVDASADLHLVWRAVDYLFRLRRFYGNADPAPLSWRFLAAWCDLPEYLVRDAMRFYLLPLEILRVARYYAGPSGRSMMLFEPAPGSVL